MTFLTKTRYGAQERYEDGADVAAIVEALIIELETEKFDEPDDEHTQVAVEHGDWAVTVMVSGLMVLDDLSEVAGRPDDQRSAARYLRPQSRDEASQMLQLMAEGRLDSVRDAPWVAEEEVSPFRLELFRSRR